MEEYSLKTPKSWPQTLSDLETTMSRWDVDHWETNTPRGSHLKGFDQPLQDRSVTLKYTMDGRTVVLTMDKQPRAVDNLRVLYLAVEAIRMNEKRGIADVVKSAYLQLEAPVQKRNPYEVLGLFDGADLAVCEAVYKVKAKEKHPDAGGTMKEFVELKEAIEAIRELKKV